MRAGVTRISRRRRSPRLWPAVTGMLVLLASMSVTGMFVGSTPRAGASPAEAVTAASATSSSAAPACPSGWTCKAEPGTGSSGAEVEIGPTSGLQEVAGAYPYVEVNLYGFPANYPVYIWYCTDNASLPVSSPTDSTTYCVESGSTYFPQSDPYVHLETFANGDSSTNFETPLVTTSDPVSLKGSIPGVSPTGSYKNMYCDGAQNKCSIDVVVPNPSTTVEGFAKNAPTQANTAVIPINFVTSASCSAAQAGDNRSIQAEGEPGMELVLPHVSKLACATQKEPWLGTDSPLDGYSAVKDAASTSSAVAVGFTQDPESSDQQAYLSSGKWLLIPVAVTADVIAFEAELSDGTTFPESTVNLTANMVAGIMTGYYENNSTDTYNCNSTDCPSPPCLSGVSVCSLLSQANGVPGLDLRPAALYGAYPRSDPSGVTDDLMHWLCSAPKGTVPITTTSGGSQTMQEQESAAQVFVAGIKASSVQDPWTSCEVTDKFPALPYTGNNWVSDSSPDLQLAKGMAPFMEPLGGGGQGTDSFATMNWAWADFLGLGSANLQNAAGDFVGPSETSIDATLNDATANTDGTLNIDPTDSQSSAYVMPAVVYAAVNLDKLGQQTNLETGAVAVPGKQAVGSFLKDILAVTGGSHTDDLPAGFVPLTPALLKEATADVDQLDPPAKKGSGGTSPSTGTGSAGSGAAGADNGYAGAGYTPGNGSYLGSTGAGSTLGAGAIAAVSPASTSHVRGAVAKARLKHHAGVPSSSPLYGPLLLAASDSRLLLPLLQALAALGIILGAMLMFWSGFRETVLGGFRKLKPRVALVAAGDEAGAPPDDGQAHAAEVEPSSPPVPPG